MPSRFSGLIPDLLGQRLRAQQSVAEPALCDPGASSCLKTIRPVQWLRLTGGEGTGGISGSLGLFSSASLPGSIDQMWLAIS